METDFPPPKNIFAGQLRREYFINADGKPVLDVPGGNALYAAVGYKLWEPNRAPGLLARVGENYPQTWLHDFTQRQIDIEGVTILPKAVDVRSFYTYLNKSTRVEDDPLPHFARLGKPFPKTLLGYTKKGNELDDRSKTGPATLRQNEIPSKYLLATAAHLCPVDYLTHNLLPAVFRQAGFTTVTLDPASGYMDRNFLSDIPALVTGLTAFLPAEEDLRRLFRGHKADLWEMAAEIAYYGCEMVVIKRGERGQLLYDAMGDKRWEILSYPARLHNPTGAGDAFCGGFLAGYRDTFDPVQAVLHGNVASSLVVEGTGPFYALDTLPGLANARLGFLQQSVRKI
ncbi:MAG: 5-dehydro-2-deoxygluconokinase [Chloroflexi bacterium]|nr:5-dehydro-2-deoxygluconokinase [Chloroflexota bacterium]